MNFEDADKKADAMLQALGAGWVKDLKDAHGWMCRVKNGKCSVSFAENSANYTAFISAGISFTASSSSPENALGAAARKMIMHFERIIGERDAILSVVAASLEVAV